MKSEIVFVTPIILLSLAAVILLLFNFFKNQLLTMSFAIVSLIAAIATLSSSELTKIAFHGSIFTDGFSVVFQGIILVGTIITVLLNSTSLADQKVAPSVDVTALILFAAIGAMVMVSAANLIVLFVGFELLSVSVYALTGLARREKASAEAALKYFILGAFSSAFLLYGMTLVYAATGTLQINELAPKVLENSGNIVMLVGLGLLIFGFCFKISAVPFHFWAPDVYQGAPISITAFMAVVVKVAAFGSLLRVLGQSFISIDTVWVGFIWLLSIFTMTGGNIMAIRQTSPKRMLSYSSISHAGYALMGLVVLGQGGLNAVTFYLISYLFMTFTAFGVLLHVTAGSEHQYEKDTIESLRGLGWTHPLSAFIMTVAMLGLAGIPPLAGFIGKFYLFSAAVKGGFLGLAIIAAMNSVISLYYYLGIIVAMYFSGEKKSAWQPTAQISLPVFVALALTTTGTIYLGLFSGNCYTLLNWALH
ncbi:MAG: NADH-quinone oxidoreductase subunit N [Proteobacteria bacterium]|nr:NADH-quinone oxidoreductase subunit N [Pseudomonadota bacterium]